jgi:hypothetical protein
MTETNPPVLSYRGPPEPPPSARSFLGTAVGRWVDRCRGFPLGLGLVIYTTMVILDRLGCPYAAVGVWHALFCELYIVVLGALVGVALTLTLVVLRWRQSNSDWAKDALLALLAIGLLAANVVMASAILIIDSYAID